MANWVSREWKKLFRMVGACWTGLMERRHNLLMSILVQWGACHQPSFMVPHGKLAIKTQKIADGVVRESKKLVIVVGACWRTQIRRHPSLLIPANVYVG